MADPLPAKLRFLDLTQLYVFSEVMQHRKLTTVAQRLGRSQPAISHIVRHLRDIFEDELFVRRPGPGGRSGGLQPTARALQLEPIVAQIVALARQALLIERPFDPASLDGAIRIAAQDYHCSLLAGPIAGLLEREASRMSVQFRPVADGAALGALGGREVDLAIGHFPRVARGQTREFLFLETYVVVARREHPRIGDSIALDAYLGERHVCIADSAESHGVVDRALAREGRSISVAATLPYYLPALAAVAESDLIATLPEFVAVEHAERFGLKLARPPLAIQAFEVSAVWDERDAANPLMPWLIGHMRDWTSSSAGESRH